MGERLKDLGAVLFVWAMALIVAAVVLGILVFVFRAWTEEPL